MGQFLVASNLNKLVDIGWYTNQLVSISLGLPRSDFHWELQQLSYISAETLVVVLLLIVVVYRFERRNV